jgi:hypothetical protein
MITPEKTGHSDRPNRSRPWRSRRASLRFEGGKKSASVVAPGVKLVSRKSAVSCPRE